MSTQTLDDDGSYAVSESLYDSFLRLRETRTGTVDGGRTITDTVYNTDGWVAKTTNPYYTTGAPGSTLVQAQDGQIPSETGFAYDGAGRKTLATAYALGTETWHTTTVFGGNFTTTVPPAGGVADAYAVQNGDGGGGGDPTHEDASAARDEGAEKLRDEHLGSKKQQVLTEENSYKALEGGPEDTTAEVNPEANGKDEQGEKNPDVKLLDRQGNVVGYREVKTIENPNQNAFMRQLSKATRQLKAKGAKINEIFFQVPKTSDAYKWLRAWQKQPGRDVSNWRGCTVRIVDDTGKELGTYDLGDADGGDLSKGGGGGGGSKGPSEEENPWANKERAMEEEGF